METSSDTGREFWTLMTLNLADGRGMFSLLLVNLFQKNESKIGLVSFYFILFYFILFYFVLFNH